LKFVTPSKGFLQNRVNCRSIGMGRGDEVMLGARNAIKVGDAQSHRAIHHRIRCMTLQQLRYFIATVESGFNISRAAEMVHTSQPGVSKQIRLLEQQLGTALLARTSSRVVGLTDAGERVLEAARRIVRETDGLTQMGRDLMKQETGRLTIASLHTYALALLPKAVSALRQRYPHVTVELRQESPGHIIEMVRAGEVDIGVSMDAQDPHNGVIAFPFLEVPRALLTPKRHPLLDLEKVTLEDMVRYPFVAQTGLSAGGWAISKVLKSRGFTFDISVLAADASLMKAYVEHGLGIAIVSSLLYDSRRDTGLAVIDVSHVFEPSTVTVLMDPYRYQRGYVHELIQLLAPVWNRTRIVQAVRQYVIDHEAVGR
jgi:LysR family cys regulon transcriptional activator